MNHHRSLICRNDECKWHRRLTYRNPCSCFLRYAEWSKKSFKCGISIFCPLTRTPPSFDDLTKLLLFIRCLFVDFGWWVLLLVRLEFVEFLGEMIAELLVSDSDTSRLDNDLLVNDNFSVVSSGTLLGELAVVCASSLAVTVVKVELSSDKISAVAWTVAASERLKLLVVVVLCNEVILESGKQKEAKSGGKVFVRFSVKSEAATSLLLKSWVLGKSQK